MQSTTFNDGCKCVVSFFQDYANVEQLLALANVNMEALLNYAYDAAAFSTGGKLPNLEFAKNHKGEADVAMFDFTCMHRAENSSMVMERRGKKLLIGLVGDCLVEVRELNACTQTHTYIHTYTHSLTPLMVYSLIFLWLVV